jgi:Uma2 family endonuclease
MATHPIHRLTPEEYLEIDRKAEIRSEYLDGEMFAMSGAGARHGDIVVNIALGLRTRLRGRCRVSANDLRVRISENGLYAYPDIVVVCGKRRFLEGGHNDTVLNPVLIFEVLSPSTADYDRGGKFAFYRQIDSLREYLVVAQDRPHVERHVRQPSGEWLLTEIDGLEATVALHSVEAELPLAEIYDDIEP